MGEIRFAAMERSLRATREEVRRLADIAWVTLALVGVTIAYVIVTGSYNWTASAGERNNENLLVIRDPPLVSRYKQEFDRLWSKHYLSEERPEAPIQ